MINKLALGVLLAFASFGVAVAAYAGFRWWQERGDTASQSVVAPVDATTAARTPGEAATTGEAEVVQGETPADLDARREADLAAAERAAEEWASQQAQQPATTTTLHPQVQAQGMERVVTIVERHSDAWPWVGPALEVAQMSFFEDLPSACDSAIGCYNHATGDIWLSLDALRERDTTSFSYFLDDRRPSDIVVHELAHAYTRSFSLGSDLLDLFGQHYAGCSGRGLDTDRLVAELLADTMTIAVTRAGSSLPNDYGYFGSGGFTGCLVDSGQPDQALFGAVYSTLFNCDSEHALDVFENHHDPMHIGPLFGDDADADAVLFTCYGIDCITPTHGCENVAEADARRDAANERLHERRCSDGLVNRGNWLFEKPGWESGCEAFVPDDVECLIDVRGREPDPQYRGDVFPGLLDKSGQCVASDCTVEGAQGEKLPGYREFGWSGDCTVIDRSPSP